MAFLKSYEQMQKNLETVRTSKGWADEQVGQQYATISRQIQALNADFQQLIVTLDEAGSSNGISSIVQVMREFVQILSKLDPAIIKTSSQLLALSFAIKSMSSISVGLINSIKNISNTTSSFSSVLSGMQNRTLKVGDGLRYIGVSCLSSLGTISALISALYALYGIMKSIYEVRNKGEIDKKELENTQAKINACNQYINVLRGTNDTEQSSATIKKDLASASDELREAIGNEAYARIMGSKDIIKALENELEALQQNKNIKQQAVLANIRASIKQSEEEAKQVRERISLMETELTALKEATKTRIALMESTLSSLNVKSKFGRKIFANLFGVSEEQAEIDSLVYNINIATDKLNKINTKLVNSRLIANKLAKEINTNIKGKIGGEVDKEEEGSKKSGGGTNYNEQLKRNNLEAKRNSLWYEGNIQAKQYANALKEITDLEEYYGATVTTISAKSSLYDKRSKELENYKNKLIEFKSYLLSQLDNQMLSDNVFSKLTNYNANASEQEKLKNIEVNKELYQQNKTYNSIVNMISSVNQKLEETKSKQIDISNNQRKVADELSNQMISDLEKTNATRIAMLNRPNSFNYDRNKAIIELETEYFRLEEIQKKINSINIDIEALQSKQDSQSAIKIEALRQQLNTEIQLREEQKAKIAELEYQKNAVINEGLASITSEFLIQGNTLRDIWSNLWKDLAREAIQRLFQVKAQASLLGSLFGLFGGTSTPAKNMASQGFDPSFGIKPLSNHTGASVGSYPKMHSGGMVEKGRLGVVPKLKDDEVLRTLQVGEEVNSVSDRRSNEILGAVAMKAIDARNQQPNNINIMALDAKTFAEYLNENADVLVAVLNKQGALGRR